MNELKENILCDEANVHERAILVLGLISGKEISIEYEGDVEEIIKCLLLGKKTKAKQDTDGNVKKKTLSVKNKIYRLRIPNTKEVLNVVPNQICYIIKKKQKETEQPQIKVQEQETKTEKKNVQKEVLNVQNEKVNVNTVVDSKKSLVKNIISNAEGTKGRCPHCNKFITKDFKTSASARNSNKKCIYCGKDIVWSSVKSTDVRKKKESK